MTRTFYKKLKKDTYTKNQKRTLKISKAYNEERVLGETNTHGTYWKYMRYMEVDNTYFCEKIADERVGMIVKRNKQC